MKPRKLKITSTPGEFATGRNTTVFLDGKVLDGVQSISVHAAWDSMVTVKIDMLAEIKSIELSPEIIEGIKDAGAAKTDDSRGQ